MLEADPDLRSAWNDYRDMLKRMTAKDPLSFARSDLEQMRDSMQRLLDHSGEGKTYQ